MAKSDDVTQALNAIDQATNDLAARVQKLIDDINHTAAEGLTGPQTENVLARLAPLVTSLNAMATSPTVPTDPGEGAAMPGPFA